MQYDPAVRLHQVVGTETTRFLYDGADIIAEYNASGAMLRRYVHGPGVDEPLVWYEGAADTDRRYLIADERGSVIAVTNNAGTVTQVNTYDAYGVPGSANAGRFQYTGQAYLKDASLYHYKARAYHPSAGRFLQTDPIGAAGAMNLYAYAGNDPINRVDPSGLCQYLIVWTTSGSWRPGDSIDNRNGEVSDYNVGTDSFCLDQFGWGVGGGSPTVPGAGPFIGSHAGAPAAAPPSPQITCPVQPFSSQGLHPAVQQKADALLQQTAAANLNARLGFTFRTIAQQNQLFAQGRTTPGRIVTNARGGGSFHNYGLAFDILMFTNTGSYITNGSDPAYAAAGQLGQGLGLTWGGTWTSPFDPSHFEFTDGLSLQQVQKNANAGRDPLCHAP